MIPPELNEMATSRAERLLFRELKAQLSDPYIVLHSVRWFAKVGGQTRDGEADFVIVHPDRGLLVIEVKGGAITWDPDCDQWTSRDGAGIEHAIHDPFAQAERSMHLLVDKLIGSPETCGFTWPYARLVAFPENLVRNLELPIWADRELVIDSSSLSLLTGQIAQAITHPGQPGPGPAGVKALLRLFRPPVAFAPNGLAADLSDERAELLRLTDNQLIVLDALRQQRQIKVQGVAGSGKTILAMEQARRLAAEGFAVLFTCFNKALARDVDKKLNPQHGDEPAVVTVRHFHQLAEELVAEAHLSPPAGTDLWSSVYFEEILPQLMIEAIEQLGPRFDAIVVDEGQDFTDIWWLALDALFRKPEERIWAIFYDDNQRLYQRSTDYPIAGPPMLLTRNCRCTRAIQIEAGTYCPESLTGQVQGPAGRPIEQVPIGSGGLLGALGGVLERLVHQEGIGADRIVVLTPRSMKATACSDGTTAGGFRLRWEDGRPSDIAVRSIHGFKGLERDIVILVECERAHVETRDALMYVALTRARHHVIVIGELPELVHRDPVG
ncbi:MAG TPA: NERD domain-containing protein [Thermomicrobiales bacterium]|nr:NERD domain-containing protein [Thermomicrobiales bacterium]